MTSIFFYESDVKLGHSPVYLVLATLRHDDKIISSERFLFIPTKAGFKLLSFEIKDDKLIPQGLKTIDDGEVKKITQSSFMPSIIPDIESEIHLFPENFDFDSIDQSLEMLDITPEKFLMTCKMNNYTFLEIVKNSSKNPGVHALFFQLIEKKNKMVVE